MTSPAPDTFQLLTWDSQMLGLPVACIRAATLDTGQLAALLGYLKHDQAIDLVYWMPHAEDITAHAAAQVMRGHLVDTKLTYSLELPALPAQLAGLAYPATLAIPPLQHDTEHESNLSTDTHAVYSYPHVVPDDALIALAIESSVYSRFRQDPRILPEQADALYRAWIHNAVKREVATQVWGYYCADQLIGMITLLETTKNISIELLAVHPHYRGQHIGKTLIQATINWAKQIQCPNILVVTQTINIPACRLYQQCGFQLAKTQHVYHFWLSEDRQKTKNCKTEKNTAMF